MSGSPDGLEIERKFLLSRPPSLAALRAHGATAEEFAQHYLDGAPGGPLRRLRIIGAGERARHLYTEKRGRGGIVREEREHDVDAATAQKLLEEADPGRGVIRKTRWTWQEDGQVWELDIFAAPPGLVMLEAEIADAAVGVSPPRWLGEVRDVSEDPAYQNAALAAGLARR